jgi:hypothetical protein
MTGRKLEKFRQRLPSELEEGNNWQVYLAARVSAGCECCRFSICGEKPEEMVWAYLLVYFPAST